MVSGKSLAITIAQTVVYEKTWILLWAAPRILLWSMRTPELCCGRRPEYFFRCWTRDIQNWVRVAELHVQQWASITVFPLGLVLRLWLVSLGWSCDCDWEFDCDWDLCCDCDLDLDRIVTGAKIVTGLGIIYTVTYPLNIMSWHCIGHHVFGFILCWIFYT